MTFSYSYKTSDGVRHVDAFEAKTREEVFAALRGRGIRPIKVWERERPPAVRALRALAGAAAVALGAAVLVGVGVRMGDGRGVDAPAGPEPSIRHQIEGVDLSDGALAGVFPRISDRLLARYSQPGERVAACAATEDLTRDFAEAQRGRIPDVADEPEPVRELKGVVAGMKEELARFMQLGGSLADYLTMLGVRQENEFRYRENAVRIFRERSPSLDDEGRRKLLESLNASLRVLGIRQIPSP